jgi:class 3 adenylate cyclase
MAEWARTPFAPRLSERARSRLTRLGAPAVTAPGARQLLTQAEAAAERGLHVARALLWLVLFVVYLGPIGVKIPALLVLVGTFVFTAVWVWLWRLISRPPLPPWTKYVLILADAWVIVRAAVTRPIVPQWFGPTFDADLLAVTPPLLVYLALSGALRLNPAAASFSTATALAAFGVLAAAERPPTHEALAVGGVILFAGGIGVGVAWVLRYVALKAREGEVLARYVPETLTRELVQTGTPERSGRHEEVTVLMADMRGFTLLSEHLTPAEAVTVLNDYFGAIVLPLIAEGAVLDRYLGDGILAHFEGEDRAARALRAARGVRRALDILNTAHLDRQPIAIGIALHAGTVLVGTIGAPTRCEYTLVGDAVNVTERLEKCNKELESVVVASVQALAGVADPSHHGFIGPRLVAVRGRNEPIAVYYMPRTVPVATAGGQA